MPHIIFLHGTSSSGKTTLAGEIKKQAAVPFWHFASDQLVEAGMLPRRTLDGGLFDWAINRPKFFNAFHQCIKAILDTGNNVILDHIIESNEWYEQLKESLVSHDVFFVGVHCPIEILKQREMARSDQHIGNRYLGEAEYHLRHVHRYSNYDFELDTSKQSPAESAKLVLSAWEKHGISQFFNGRS